MTNQISDCPRFKAFLEAAAPDIMARRSLQELLGAALGRRPNPER